MGYEGRELRRKSRGGKARRGNTALKIDARNLTAAKIDALVIDIKEIEDAKTAVATQEEKPSRMGAKHPLPNAISQNSDL